MNSFLHVVHFVITKYNNKMTILLGCFLFSIGICVVVMKSFSRVLLRQIEISNDAIEYALLDNIR